MSIALDEMSRRNQIVKILIQLYPSLESQLKYTTPFELLVAVSLSAQCTDAMVNRISPALFAAYPNALAMSKAPLNHLEELVFKTGFYKNKARNVLLASKRLVEVFNHEVPQSLENLVSLAGIGRKSAHVLRGHLWGLPAIIVDTHFGRVMRRLGFTLAQNPVQLERDIADQVKPELQMPFSMAANNHGRQVCKARSPLCKVCPLGPLCPSFFPS